MCSGLYSNEYWVGGKKKKRQIWELEKLYRLCWIPLTSSWRWLLYTFLPTPQTPVKPLLVSKIFFALQCCVSFCCTAKCICHACTYILSLLALPPSPYPTPPGHDRTRSWALCVIQLVLLAFYSMHGSVHMLVLLSQLIPPHPACPLHAMSVLSICVSAPALQVGSAVPFF